MRHWEQPLLLELSIFIVPGMLMEPLNPGTGHPLVRILCRVCLCGVTIMTMNYIRIVLSHRTLRMSYRIYTLGKIWQPSKHFPEQALLYQMFALLLISYRGCPLNTYLTINSATTVGEHTFPPLHQRSPSAFCR